MTASAAVHATPTDLSLWIDGELSPERARQVEAHVDECADCRRRYLSTLELVQGLRALERAAPPSTLGMVVEQHRVEVGNRKLRQRLERSWRRWPDPMILTYLGVVLALGVMVVLISRIEAPGPGTVIRAPAEAPTRALGETEGLAPALGEDDAEAWIEPGIGVTEAESALLVDETRAASILARLDGVIPSQARVVIARDGGDIVRVELGEPTHDPRPTVHDSR